MAFKEGTGLGAVTVAWAIMITVAFFKSCALLGITRLIEILKECTHVNDVEIPEKVGDISDKELFENFRKTLAENKPKKGGKKKGGGKKKKKR
mgnify:CR=1 FL=1